MDPFNEAVGGYQLEVWVVPSPSGRGYSARVTVRRTPTLCLVYEDESVGEGAGWALSQQALAAGFERARQFVRIDTMDRAAQAAQSGNAVANSNVGLPQFDER
jgi:hypothetical protein